MYIIEKYLKKLRSLLKAKIITIANTPNLKYANEFQVEINMVSEKKELKKFNAQKIIKNLKKLLSKYFHNLKNRENKINKIEDRVIKMSGIAGPEIIEIGTRYIKTEKKNDKLLIALLVSFNI